MKTMLFLIFAAIFAMLPLGATAHGLRLRRIRPLIDVTLGSVREIVDPFGSFVMKRNRHEEDKKVIDEQEDGNSFSLSYDYELSMSMSMSMPDVPMQIETSSNMRRHSPLGHQGRFR